MSNIHCFKQEEYLLFYHFDYSHIALKYTWNTIFLVSITESDFLALSKINYLKEKKNSDVPLLILKLPIRDVNDEIMRFLACQFEQNNWYRAFFALLQFSEYNTIEQFISYLSDNFIITALCEINRLLTLFPGRVLLENLSILLTNRKIPIDVLFDIFPYIKDSDKYIFKILKRQKIPYEILIKYISSITNISKTTINKLPYYTTEQKNTIKLLTNL